MSAAVPSTSIGRAVCEALGIEPSRVTRLVITLDAKDIVRVDVSRYPTQAELDAALAVLQANRAALHVLDRTLQPSEGVQP